MFDNDLTIVFQGPIIEDITLDSILSVRETLPNVKIILSTWEDDAERAERIQKAIPFKISLILNKDPGAKYIKPNSPLNINRLIVSSLSGVKAAKTQYVFKCRSDIKFINNGFVEIYNNYCNLQENNGRKFFEKRVLVSNQTTLDPLVVPILYHICDWLALGKKTDLIKMFDIDLMTDEDFHWFLKNRKPEDLIDPGRISRYCSEDYLGYKLCAKFISAVDHKDYYHSNDEQLKLWRDIIGDNFIIASNFQIGVVALKYKKLKSFFLYKSYSHVGWKVLSGIDISFSELIVDLYIKKIRFFLYMCYTVFIQIRSNLKI